MAPQDRWLHALWRRRRRPFLSAAALLLIAAFLLWGPIGLGNGPLGVPAMYDHFGSVDATSQPMVYVASLVNAGRSAAVIDGVTVISAHGYPAERLISVRVARASSFGCIDNGPVSGVTVCARPPFLAAAGFAVGPGANTKPGNRHGPALVIEMAGPPAARCVVLTTIVLRYHLGIRHYTATVPQGEVWMCGKHARQPQS
ncbi:MAG TPA: hypothetical protein VGH96_04065 [Streptosporangiaceae bacterium]